VSTQLAFPVATSGIPDAGAIPAASTEGLLLFVASGLNNWSCDISFRLEAAGEIPAALLDFTLKVSIAKISSYIT
jgi:hypothetical protein